MGYEYVGKTAQNLRDKIAHIDKSTKTTSLRIANDISNQIEQREDQSSSSIQRNREQGTQVQKKIYVVLSVYTSILQHPPKRGINKRSMIRRTRLSS